MAGTRKSSPQPSSNPDFAEYVTATAFALTLTKRMVELLLIFESTPHLRIHPIDRTPSMRERSTNPTGYSHFVPTVSALRRRGLVAHYPGDPKARFPGATAGHWITEEGLLVAALCKRAGFADG